MTSTCRLAAIGLTALLNAPLGAGSSAETRATGGTPTAPALAAALSHLPAAAEAQVSEALGRDRSSYHAVARAYGFRMENPRHRLAADFSAQGVDVRAGAETWGFAFRGYGRGATLPDPTPAAPHASANRVEYRRGSLTEWYVNGPAGLEQGFTLTEAPAGGRAEPLTLTFSLSGAWERRPTPPVRAPR